VAEFSEWFFFRVDYYEAICLFQIGIKASRELFGVVGDDARAQHERIMPPRVFKRTFLHVSERRGQGVLIADY